MKHRCPICKKIVKKPTKSVSGQQDTFFPFCSQQCRLIDLGSWLESSYRIPVKPNAEEEDD